MIFAKNVNCELEIRVKAKKGRTALQPEALRRAPVARQTTLHTAFSPAIGRESHAGLGSSLKSGLNSPIQAQT